MNCLVLLYLLLSIFFSIETNFSMTDLKSKFSDQELSHIISSYNNLVTFVDAINNKEPEQA
ncbi:MAG: hypothetical protein JO129_04695, partial [Candidatus Dependentiae bacterium]|nr:hypothetical protein [Candidatus Dependentiae bacterium]